MANYKGRQCYLSEINLMSCGVEILRALIRVQRAEIIALRKRVEELERKLRKEEAIEQTRGLREGRTVDHGLAQRQLDL